MVAGNLGNSPGNLRYCNKQDCDNARLCYYADSPHIYETSREVLGCWFRHTDRASLPPLLYQNTEYNVVIHVSLRNSIGTYTRPTLSPFVTLTPNS